MQDDVYAHMWWSIAASQGNKNAAENRDKVAKEMTSADISVAQNLARECMKKNYKDSGNRSQKFQRAPKNEFYFMFE